MSEKFEPIPIYVNQSSSSYNPLMSPAEFQEWAVRLSAESWDWAIWKPILVSSGWIVLWALFFGTFLSMLLMGSKLNNAVYTHSTKYTISGFLISEIVFSITHPAIFNGPYGYWLHSTFSSAILLPIEEWSFKILSFFGFLLTLGSL